MALHRNFDRFLPTLEGNVMTAGGSLNLAKGQLGVFAVKKNSKNGLTALADFAGLPDTEQLQLRVGQHENAVLRTQGNKGKYSSTFQINEIQSIEVNAPDTDEKVDDILVGWNGTAGSELTFEEGDNDVLNVTLEGEALGMLGNHKGEASFNLYFKKNDGATTNQEIVERAVASLKGDTLAGGVPILDFVNVDVVNSENPDTVDGAVSHTYYNLTLTDGGDSLALANVQAQYGSLQVKRSNQNGLTSVYTVVRPTTDGAPDAYVQTVGSIIKGCEDCPSGFTAVDGGLIYYVTLEDDGADSTTTVQGLPGAIAGTAEKQGNNHGKGLYVVALDDALTDAELATFSASNPTATVQLVGETADICNNSTETTVAWTAGDVCNATSEVYQLQLADDDCGNNRLAEVQAAYPDLTIAVADSDNTQSDVTLTGTSGTATITIDGTDYVATFNTDLATTAADFVAANAAAIQTAHGMEVTAEGAVISFLAPTEGFTAPTIANTTTDLAGTVETAVAVSDLPCQTLYETTVTSDIRCEDCDPAFRGLFETEAPAAFGDSIWVKEEAEYSATAKMGIRIRGKQMISNPPEYMRDNVPFINDSIHISVAGGHYEGALFTVNEGGEPFAVKILQRAQKLANLGGDLWALEDRDFTYFNGHPRHAGNEYAKFILGEESVLKGNAQYVVYNVKVAPETRSQSFAGVLKEGFVYMIAAEVGKHQEIEAVLNKLAARAGVPGVKAYGA